MNLIEKMVLLERTFIVFTSASFSIGKFVVVRVSAAYWSIVVYVVWDLRCCAFNFLLTRPSACPADCDWA